MESSKHMDQGKKKWSGICSFFSIKNATKQLQKHFLYIFRRQAGHHNSSRSIYNFATTKKGNFPVIVCSNGEAQKFFVELRYLAYPPFMKLLDTAVQEYGFNQKGVLVIPCEASELKRILSEECTGKMEKPQILIGWSSRKMT